MQPTGLYRGIVKDWGVKQASTGKFQHYLLFEIPEKAKDDSSIEGGFDKLQKPFLRTVFKAMTPKTRQWLLTDLQALGYDRPSLVVSAITPNNDDSFKFGGRAAVLECTHELYKGAMKERWQITTRKGSSKLTTEDISQLDQMFSEEEALDGYDPFAEVAEPVGLEPEVP